MAQNRAAALRAKRQWVLELPDGVELLVRKPSILDLVEAGLNPIVADVSATEEQRNDALEEQIGEFKNDLRKFLPFARKLLKASMIDPKLHLDEDVPCPDDAVTPADLGDSIFFIATTVMNEMAKEVGEGGKDAARFRVDSNGQGSAESGAVVRDEPARDPASATA